MIVGIDPREVLPPASPVGTDTPPSADTAEPVAGGPTGEAPQPGAGGEAVPGRDEWDQLPEWAQHDILSGRRSVRSLRQQIEGQGWRIDERGQVLAPEPPPSAPGVPRTPEGQVRTAGLSKERQEHFLTRLRNARVSDDPDREELDVLLELGGEMATVAAAVATRAVAPMTMPATISAYRQAFREDPKEGELFKRAEPEFDALVKQAQAEAHATGVALIFDNEVMGYIRQLAIGRAAGRIIAEAGSARSTQASAAARTASAVTVAGGSPGGPAVPTTPLTGEESTIIGRLARGAGVDPTALGKDYSERKRRGE